MGGSLTVTDALGRRLTLAGPAQRVVSLVPSETETVAALAGLDRVVGRTRYCVEPAALATVPELGGTKDADVDGVAALAPDLVLCNQEESSRALVERLIERGLPVHVSFPRTVLDSVRYLETVALLLGVPEHPHVARAREVVERAARRASDPIPVFVPIWNEPLMTFDGRAYASDLLEICGAHNVFSDRPRRYPLAADLGLRDALSGERVAERDTRYPRIRIEEARERAPALVLLPDEPYAFGEDDRVAMERALGARSALVSGRHLFWYGVHTPTAIEALTELLGKLRPLR